MTIPAPPPVSRAWVKALVVLLVLVVVVGVLVAGCTAVLVSRGLAAVRPLFDTGNAYLAALADDDVGRALSLRCDRSELGVARDRAALTAVGWTGVVDLTGLRDDAQGHHVHGTAGTASGNVPVTVGLRDRGAAGWCVTRVTVPGGG